jgi:hypothetical protein
VKIISVDLQREFAKPGGKWFQPRPCVAFIENELLPHLMVLGLKVAEIVSDYRLPRPNEQEAYCIPGQSGFQSIIPDTLKDRSVWIKAMNSPVWVRENAGYEDKPPGAPYPDPQSFTNWLCNMIGPPHNCPEVLLIGLTLDCCVLCTAQELYYRGYTVRYLVEGVDTYLGTQEEKDNLLRTPLPMWGKSISWKDAKQRLLALSPAKGPGPLKTKD